MRKQVAPAAATWFLKLFCSGPEHESVTGDLLEQYQNGRGWFWYWRQVLDLVLLELYRKIGRRPLIRTGRLSIPMGLALVLVIGVLLTVLLSDLWFLGLGVLLGLIVGCFNALKYAYDNNLISPGDQDLIGLGPIPVDKLMIDAPLQVSAKSEDYQAMEPPMHVHRGINSASIAGEGLEGLPGLVMMIFFVFAFVSLFLPRDNEWILVVFFAVEIGAAGLYIMANHRDRKDAAQLRKTLHEINTPHAH